MALMGRGELPFPSNREGAYENFLKSPVLNNYYDSVTFLQPA